MKFSLFEKRKFPKNTFDATKKVPVLKCSICTGEQVAGFKDLRTGAFEELALIKNQAELAAFMQHYGIESIRKEY